MRRLILAATVAAVHLAGQGRAEADQVTYTETFSFMGGELGSAAFPLNSTETITLTETANPNATVTSGNYLYLPGTVSFTISGNDGSGTFNGAATGLTLNTSTGSIGFYDTAGGFSSPVLSATNPALEMYNLVNSMSEALGSAGYSPPIATTAGTLTINSLGSTGTFNASPLAPVAPVPPSLLMLGSGLAGSVGLRFARVFRRRAAASIA